MDNELTRLFEERVALKEAIAQLSDYLNNDGLHEIENQLKFVQERIEYIMEDNEDSHGF